MKKMIRCLICITIGVILYCYSFGGVIDNKQGEELGTAIKTTLQDTTSQETTTVVEETTIEETTSEETTIKEITTKESTTKKEPITKESTTKKSIIKEIITKKQQNYIDRDVPDNTIKSYMDYRTITSTNSKQYKFQKSAYTDSNGLRMVDGRYCVAVGSYYTTTIGQHIDIELENGKIIKGVLADCKADIHTDSTNRVNPNGSVIEFIVDVKVLDKTAKKMGDISYVNGWNSKVVNIRVYDTVEKF